MTSANADFMNDGNIRNFTRGDSWPPANMALLDSGRKPAPAFPTHALPPTVAQLVVDLAEAKGAPVDFSASALLSFAAGLVGNARRFSPWSSWSEPCAINVGNVGAPSSGKSPSVDVLIEIVRSIETGLLDEFDATIREYETKKATAEEARDRWRSDVKTAVETGQPAPTMPEAAIEPDEPGRPVICVADATTEAIVRAEAHNPKGLIVFRDELSGLFLSFGRYGNDTDRAYYLEANGGRPFRQDRVKNPKPIVVDRHLLSICGGIQPDRVDSLLIKKADDDGLAARFLFTWPDAQRPRRPTTAFDPAPLQDAFRRLYALELVQGANGLEPLTMKLAAEAADRFEEVRQRLYDREQAAAKMLKSFFGKTPGMLLRLSGLLELLERACIDSGDWPTTVSAGKIEAGETLIEYFIEMAERVYGEAGMTTEEKNAACIAREIHRRRAKVINTRTIRTETWVSGLRKAADVDAAIRCLEEEDWLKPVPRRAGETKGRLRKDFLVNPCIPRSDSSVGSVSNGVA